MLNFNNALNNTGIILNVNRHDVERGHIMSYLNFINKLEKKKSRMLGRLIILFDGYNFDSREIYEIQEVRSWVERLFSRKPYIFYYLHEHTGLLFHLCLTEYKISYKGNGQVNVQLIINKEILNKIIKNCVSHSMENNDSIETNSSLIKLLSRSNIEFAMSDYFEDFFGLHPKKDQSSN